MYAILFTVAKYNFKVRYTHMMISLASIRLDHNIF